MAVVNDAIDNILYNFVKNVVKETESRMVIKWKLLFGEEKNVGKRTKMIGDAAATTALVFPVIGKPLKEAIKTLVDKGGQTVQKREASKLERLIFKFDNNKEQFRRELVKFAIEIFYIYEFQIMRLDERDVAIVNLAKDIIHRIMEYNKTTRGDDFHMESITTSCSVLSENSIHLPSGCSLKYVYKDKSGKCTSSQLFENIYVCTNVDEGKKEVCYSAISREAIDFGYRRHFLTENIKLITNDYVIGKRTKKLFSKQVYVKNYDFYEAQIDQILEKLKEDRTDLGDKRNDEIFKEIKDEVKEILELFKDAEDLRFKVTEHIDYVKTIKIEECVDSLHQHFESAKDVVLETLSNLKESNERNFGTIVDLVKHLDEKISEKHLKKRKYIKFGSMKPVNKFVGRQKEINSIHSMLLNEFEKGYVPRTLTISGLGGVGKSELVRAYIKDFRNNFDNIVFINAEKKENLINSFTTLAVELNISIYDRLSCHIKESVINYEDHIFLNDENRSISNKFNVEEKRERDIKFVIKDVLEYFNENGKTLFVYDNVETYSKIANFLPPSNDEKCSIYVLITSRCQDWNIDIEGEIKVVQLDVFDNSEAEDYVKNFLMYDGEDVEEILKLINKLQNLPLALCQAVRYINQQAAVAKKMKKVDVFKIRNYLNIFDKQSSTLLEIGVNDKSDRYNKTVMTTWNITMEKIAEDEEDGVFAIKLINILAYLSPENINMSKLFSRFEMEKIDKAILLLENYSMIAVRDGMVSIHRIVQNVIRANLRKDNREMEVIKEVLWLLFNTNFEEHVVIVWEYASRYGNLVKAFYSKSEYGNGRNKITHLLAKYRNDHLILDNILKHMQYQVIHEENTWHENMMHIAAEHGNVEIIKFVYNLDSSLSYIKNWRGEIPINVAIRRKRFEIVEVLDHFKKDLCCILPILFNVVEKRDLEGFRSLIQDNRITMNNFFLDTIWRLLLQKANKEMLDMFLKHNKDFLRNTSLIKEVIEENNLEALCFLIENGLDVNVEDGENFTLLCYAAWNGNRQMAKLLLEKGADVSTNTEGPSALHCAAWNGDILIIEELINYGDNVNHIQGDGLYPIHYAAWNNNCGAVELLLKNGADVNETTGEGMTSLHFAARAGNAEVVELLLNKGAKVNISSKYNISPLHYASRIGKIDIVRNLLIAGAAINAIDIHHLTPVHYALKNGNNEAAKVLLERNFNINTVTKRGLTLLHMATRNDSVEMVKYLIEKNANVNVESERGLTPLHNSARNGNVEITELLLKNGANVNVCSKVKVLPLHYASRSGNIDVVKAILKKENLVQKITAKKETPLHFAAIGGSIKVVEYLLSNGAMVNVFDKNKETPLHVALKNVNEDVATCLIQHGADVNAESSYNKTPLHIASAICSLEMVLLLLNSKARVDILDINGLSALHFVFKNNNPDIVDILLDRGSNIDLLSKNHINSYMSPLHCALYSANDKIAIRLIERGASLKSEANVNIKFMHYACRNCDVSTIKKLIQKGMNVNVLDNYKMTPLHYAILGGRTDVVKLLLDEEANTELLDDNELSPLDYALSDMEEEFWLPIIARGCIEYKKAHRECRNDIIVLLLNKGASIDSGESNIKKMHFAAATDSVTIISLMLKRGAELNIKDDQKMTPLHYALYNKCNDVAHYLLDKGAEVNVVSKSGITPLHYAVLNSDMGLIKRIIEKGAALDSKTNSGLTLLHCASWKGNLRIVQMLVDKGVNLEIADESKLTALHYASRENNINVVKYFLSKIDCRKSLLRQEDFSPLHIASESGCTESVILLLSNNANIDCIDDEGFTPLHYAIREKQQATAIILLEKGANPNFKTKNFFITPLHYAARNGCCELVNLLLDKGAVIDTEDDQKLQPIHYAALGYKFDVIQILINRGANINVVDCNGASVLHYILRRSVDQKFSDNLMKGMKIKEEFEESSSTLQFASREREDNVVLNLFNKTSAERNVIDNNISSKDKLKILKYLLDKKMNVNIQNEFGNTVLHLVISTKNDKAFDILIEHGKELNVNILNKARMSAFDLAVEKDNEHMMEILRQHITYNKKTG